MPVAINAATSARISLLSFMCKEMRLVKILRSYY